MQRDHRFYEIDLVRFVAAVGVLFYHYTFRGSAPDHLSAVAFPELAPWFRYCYLGLHLFFIMSGFVVLLTALDRNAREFIVSRVTRLYPAYWTCVTVTFVATWWLSDGRFSVSVWQYVANLTMLQEVAKVSPVDGVYWSLTVELKFYFMVFLLVLFRQIHRLQYFLGGWLLASVALDNVDGYVALRFFLVPGYSYFFIAGAVFLLVWLQGMTVYRLLLLVASFIGGLHFVIRDSRALAAFHHADFDPWMLGIILAGFYVLFLAIAWEKTKRFGRPGFMLLGALTYPLYLLHQNIGYMLFNLGAPYFSRWILLGAISALVLGLAYVVHRGVERPYSRHLKRLLMRVLWLRTDTAVASGRAHSV